MTLVEKARSGDTDLRLAAAAKAENIDAGGLSAAVAAGAAAVPWA